MHSADARTPDADVGHVEQLEQALHRAVLAERAVQHREHDVGAEQPARRRAGRARRPRTSSARRARAARAATSCPAVGRPSRTDAPLASDTSCSEERPPGQDRDPHGVPSNGLGAVVPSPSVRLPLSPAPGPARRRLRASVARLGRRRRSPASTRPTVSVTRRAALHLVPGDGLWSITVPSWVGRSPAGRWTTPEARRVQLRGRGLRGSADATGTGTARRAAGDVDRAPSTRGGTACVADRDLRKHRARGRADSSSRSCHGDLKPRALERRCRLAPVWPTTDGDRDTGGPVEMTSVTVCPPSSWLPAGGSVEIARFSSIAAARARLDSSMSNPAFCSAVARLGSAQARHARHLVVPGPSETVMLDGRAGLGRAARTGPLGDHAVPRAADRAPDRATSKPASRSRCGRDADVLRP